MHIVAAQRCWTREWILWAIKSTLVAGNALEAHEAAVHKLQKAIVALASKSDNEDGIAAASEADSLLGSRHLRRLILASKETGQAKDFIQDLWAAYKSRGATAEGQSKKVGDVFLTVVLMHKFSARSLQTVDM